MFGFSDNLRVKLPCLNLNLVKAIIEFVFIMIIIIKPVLGQGG